MKANDWIVLGSLFGMLVCFEWAAWRMGMTCGLLMTGCVFLLILLILASIYSAKK